MTEGNRREPAWRERKTNAGSGKGSRHAGNNHSGKSHSKGSHSSHNDGWNSGNRRGENRNGNARYDRRGGHSSNRGEERNDRRGGYRNNRSYGRGNRRDDNERRSTREYDVKEAYKSRYPKEPYIPDRVSESDLDSETWRALSGLPVDNARLVAKHLVMAGSLIDIDPDAAVAHTRSAVARATRIGAVREAAAIAEYTAGNYADTLKEIRAARRLSGHEDLRAIEADCERGLGHPDKAIEIINETDFTKLDEAAQVELKIVESGARADMGEAELALLLVEQIADEYPDMDEELQARVDSVRADRLEELGRNDEADSLRSEIPVAPEPVSIIDVEEVADADTPYTASDLQGSSKPLIDAFDTIMLDLDGVCYLGEDPAPHAAEVLEQVNSAVFMTNNAIRTPAEVVQKLAGFGINTSAEYVMTSAIDGAGLLGKRLPPGAKVLVIGENGLVEAVTAAGFEIVQRADEHPAAVVQGLGRNITYEMLEQGAYAVAAGAMFVGTNMDPSVPTGDGPAPGNGSLLKVIETATGQEPFVTGKPHATIYKMAADLRPDTERPLAVGDRLDTDVAGARAAGYRSMHVLTGAQGFADVALAERENRPSFIARDLRGLLVTHPGPVKNPTGVWTAGDSYGFSIGERGEVLREKQAITEPLRITENDYRALIAAIWEAKDEGRWTQIPQVEFVDEHSEDDLDYSLDQPREAPEVIHSSSAVLETEETTPDTETLFD
ncbi:MAG: HAD-IIA family hydrolase [Varibaculum sp.]|nr:HAD-IIA family hydrolase [Varibaculum sp.]